MFIRYFLLINLIFAYDNNSVIYIHEELPSNILLHPSISSANIVQWLPSSYVFQSYFRLNSNSSLYTTNHSIDREEFCEKKLCNCSLCLINLNFLQIFSTNNISTRTIQLIIEDVNDHSPIFKQSTIKLPIAENVPITYEIPLESAIDNDYGLLSIQNYKLYPMDNNPFYLLENPKPILKLKEVLDREIKANYILKLMAFDGGQPCLAGEQIIEIIITDVNDNSPVFDQTVYQISLGEDQPIDSMILKIHANDQDEGENARINYSIDDPSSTFTIHHRTGDIYLKKSLDYEKIRFYSITIKANDHGLPQLNNYATLIINVTDVNDHTPNILLTHTNGSRISNPSMNVSECSLKDTSLLYIYLTDDDSGDNSRVHCQLNDTRLNLIALTTNAYSLQISGSPRFDYESEQSADIHLQCRDFGIPSLSNSIILSIQIEDCNDNPPEILSPLPFNQTWFIPYETTKLPFLITQLIIDDRDQYQLKKFSYSFLVSPQLDINISENGTLILNSMPQKIGLFTINITIYDIGNLTNELIIPIEIYSITDRKEFHIEKNTNLILFLIFFILIFLTAIFISICFLIHFIIRKNLQKKLQENSSRQSITSSNEQANSSQKTIIEILDQVTNSSNRIYQQAANMKVINRSGMNQSDFDYSEKVERYLTHLNDRVNGKDTIDEGVYGSSDISYDHNRRTSIDSIHSSQPQQQHYHDSLKRFEQLYSLVEQYQQTNIENSTFTSHSLYV